MRTGFMIRFCLKLLNVQDENLDEAYQKLLEKKREIENRYRAQGGDFTSNSKVSILTFAIWKYCKYI